MGFLRNNENYAWLNQSGANASAGAGITVGETVVGAPNGVTTGLAIPPNGGAPSCSSVNNDCGCFYGGCTDQTAQNYDPNATCDDGNCVSGIFGCTDSSRIGYSSGATYDDGTCGATAVSGCSDPNATNYNSQANIDCSGQAVGSGNNSSQTTNNSGSVGMTVGFDGRYSNACGGSAYSNFNQKGFGGYNDSMWFND